MAATQREALPVRNPRTGEIDYHITPASAADVAATCQGLRRAQPAWSEAGVECRTAAMRLWAERIKAHRMALVEADSIDTGYGQISRVAPDMILAAITRSAAFAPAAFQHARRAGASPGAPHVKFDTHLKPYPLVGVISPWNAPLMLSTLHVIAPLLAGCAVVVKPSEIAPRFVAPLMQTIREVPDLANVLTFVQGDGETGEAIVQAVDIVNFTGSVANGRKVAEACAKRFIPAILELGGKDPVIITENADLETAATAVLRGAVTSTGQVCFSIERIYVQEKVHDAFVDRLVRKAEEVELNFPHKERGQISPFISARQAEIVDAHLADALAKGAVIRTGGKSMNLGGGLYMRPTVLTGVSHQMTIMKDETFGPVMPVMKYRTEDEAVRLANDTYYGLSAAVIGGNAEEARRIGEKIDAGALSIQDTFLTFAGYGVVEWESFRCSGMSARAPGIAGFLRKQAVLINTAEPACLVREGLQAVA
jgi:acyl-CoA reductase-like NAD-dependent aldehyde dehydrogenase